MFNFSDHISVEDKFTCSMCGACCSNLTFFHGIYDSLDRGDGVCKYFNCENKLCLIYDNRPKICNVKLGYELFKSQFSYTEYIHKTKEVCELLQKINS